MAGKFQVDSEGFRRRVAWRGAFGAISELISNSFDENINTCTVTFNRVSGCNYNISVEDDSPDGFRDLSESYTLYADSYKAGIPDKRGRFNVGEKVAIAICDTASIESTTGSVHFTHNEVKRSRTKRSRGSLFTGTLRCTIEQYEEALAALRRIIAPKNVTFSINGLLVDRPQLVTSTEASLPTIGINGDNELFKTDRKTRIDIYRRDSNHPAYLYELGIPVVAIDHPYLLDVRQKVPLSTDRNAVKFRYYRKLCAAVLDASANDLNENTARSKGVTEGISLCTNDDAVRRVMELQHGVNRFVPDPNNREATGTLVARNFTSVPPNAYDRETWDRIRETGAVPSGSDLIPRQGTDHVPFPTDKITPAMRRVEALAVHICKVVLGKTLTVTYSNGDVSALAQCGPRGNDHVELTFHVKQLGVNWFDPTPMGEGERARENVDLIIHELAHHKNDQDCTRAHADQITYISSRLIQLALYKPGVFADFR